MGLLQRHFWFAAAASVTLTFAAVSLSLPRGPVLTAFADLIGLVVLLAATGILLANGIFRQSLERWFWAMMAFGFALWAFNEGAWVLHECILHTSVPDPSGADAILFFHLVPVIAAVAWRPDQRRQQQWFRRSALNFLMLLAWWMFLYAFLVIPHQYVVVDKEVYDHCYNVLYEVENVLLLGVLALTAWNSSGAWRRLYLHLFAASAVYMLGSQALDEALGAGSYFSGSLYDIPLVAASAWMAAAALSARKWDLKAESPQANPRWKALLPHMASLAVLSLPVLGIWTLLVDQSPAASRMFRLFTVLAAMVVLGMFMFLRQYMQDQTLMQLLEESRQSYQSQQRLQSHLVQKEKLASLGTLIAGAANEINHPVENIMDVSQQLWHCERLTEEQDKIVRKIVNQARRTRDLVSDLRSFAQQAPGDKAPVDLSILLHRSAQMQEAKHHGSRIRVEISIPPDFPRVHGNANKLFQAFIEIIENAMDSLEETRGGSLRISAQRRDAEVELQFSDSGVGIREPDRVFDPFYTTKPVGRGTGLGLSAVYGVVRDHDGQITCQNKPEGGALFIVRLPLSTEIAAQAASARA